MQHCIKTITAQREKRERWEIILQSSRALEKTEEDWKERDEGEGRIVIERKDLFDITREKERDGRTRGRFKEDFDKGGRVRKGHWMK